MRRAAVLLLAAAVGLPLLVHAQAGRAPSDAAVTLGRTTIVNHGLDGVGRISASTIDPFGETFGSVSGLQITDWSRAADGSYTGVFNILPDRGYNGAGFLADYAARVTRVAFRFTPYTGAAPLGGGTIADEIARQRQIDMVGPMTSTRFAYVDPVSRERRTTTGLDPAGASLSLFGQPMPYVRSYMGPAAPGAAPSGPYPIEKLTIDAEALALERDGSGYIGDEYGPNIYYFDSSKTIVGAIVPPEAFRPHAPAHVLNFTSIGPPASGRRPNQGFEGVALSPDGQRLFALLQSSVVQDGDPAVNNQLSRHTRLLVYDVSVTHTP